MKKSTLLRDYGKLPDAKLSVKAEDIITSLTDNDNFPVTVPTLAMFTTCSSDFTTAINNVAQGGKVAVSEKNVKREILINMMNSLALNVIFLAEGDRTKLLSSGFDLAAESPSRNQLTAPTNFMLTDGYNAGELRLSIKPVKVARSYNYEFTPEPYSTESKWSARGSSSSEFVFANMEVGKRVFCKVTAIGTRGQAMSSNVLSRIVQ